MTPDAASSSGEPRIYNAYTQPPSVAAAPDYGFVLACEHASNFIPPEFNRLGLQAEDLEKHIAWDIGAEGLALALSKLMHAPLVAATASRLVYDCNRPPKAQDAIPVQSDGIRVQGNEGLSPELQQKRIDQFYEPFHMALAQQLKTCAIEPILITIHSFTPVMQGVHRDVQIGVLCDRDTRLASALMMTADDLLPLVVRQNEPYRPEDGVTHTIQRHGIANGILNIMLEVRQDLLANQTQQEDMASLLAPWLRRGVAALRTIP